MSIPDHLLERYRLGELSRAEREAVEKRLTDADSARLDALAEDDREILERYPARVMAIEIERRRQAARPRWIVPTVGVGMTLAGVGVAMAIALGSGATDPTAHLPEAGFGGEVIYAKGDDARVLVYAEADPSEPLSGEEQLAAGDRIQLKLNAGDARFAALLSVDGRGVVTRHLPLSGSAPAEVERGRTLALPSAYTLDDAPEFERFFLITSEDPFAVDEVEAAARRLAQSHDPAESELGLADELHVHDHLLRKVNR